VITGGKQPTDADAAVENIIDEIEGLGLLNS